MTSDNAGSAASAPLWSDFIALCDCGGRQAGTDSEARAIALLRARLDAIAPGARVERVPYAAWRLHEAALTLIDGTPLTCNPLLGSQSTPQQGLTLEICDVGRGTPGEFERNADRIRGRCVIVRHEYPFRRETIHRRRKLGWAIERGAAAFMIASAERGIGPVSGSSGRAGGAGIPAIGSDFESAEQAIRSGHVHLRVLGEDFDGESVALILDLPGKTPQWVALSAHLDGHHLAESAMDNATGVAVVLDIARRFAPRVASSRRGLRVCLFSAEEWALAGSRSYLDRMDETERRSIAVNVNLDTVGGDSLLTALTSEFAGLDRWVRDIASLNEFSLPTYQPMMPNSDHYNFARHGIPALRLVCGFDRPESDIRYILTRGDTREKVRKSELELAARIAGALVERALDAPDEEMMGLRG